MPRKAKEKIIENEINDENIVTKDVKSKSKKNNSSSKKIEELITTEEIVVKKSRKSITEPKKESVSSTKSKKVTTSSSKKDTPDIEIEKNAKKSTSSAQKTSTKSNRKSSASAKESSIKTDRKSTTSAKESSAKSTRKSTVSAKESSTKSTRKSTVSAKEASTKSTKKTTASSKKSSTTTTKKRVKKTTETTEPLTQVAEYYDLPYTYNNTIVKLLAQTPKTLFVYWEVSDLDIKTFKKQFGEDFFNITKPVLIVHNLTLNKTSEVEINDFANCWYLNTEDADCKYDIELARKFINAQNTSILENQYLTIAKSNSLHSPNDHIAFEKLGNFIKFKDTSTGETIIKSIKSFGFLKDLYDFYIDMYNDEILKNPSSNFSF